MSLLERLRSPVRLWSENVMDAGLVAYAVWTALCHAVMLFGGSVRVLSSATLATLLVAALGGVWVLRRRGSSLASSVAGRAAELANEQAPRAQDAALVQALESSLTVSESEARDVPAADLRTSVVLGVLALLAGAVFFSTGSRLWLFACAAGFVLVAIALSVARDEALPASVPATRRARMDAELAVFGLALASVLLALVAHRWRNDDCYYVNLAVAMVDRPELPLLSLNTIHDPLTSSPASAAVFPPYRVHSFEALGGLIAYWSGLDAIRVMHMGLAGGAAFFVPLALAQLFRLLDPKRWLFLVLGAMCVHVFEGSSGLGFGNQGLVRMFTGKSLLLSIGVPLLARHGLAFGLSPTRRGFGLLLAAQIAAVGFSSTALWLAPLAAMVGVCATLRRSMTFVRATLLGLLSTLYALGLALWVRAQLVGDDIDEDAAETAGEAIADAADDAGPKAHVGLVSYWMKLTFGDDKLVVYAMFGALFAGIVLARTALARRYLIAFSAALVLVFINPYFADFIRLNVTGAFTGQRGLWLAPIPAAVALALAACIPDAAARGKRMLGTAVALVALFAFYALVPSRSVLARDNDVVLRWPPGPKVPQNAFTLAERLSRELPQNALVLAPKVVSWYLPTIHQHRYPVVANAKYLREPADDQKRRKQLVDMVSEQSDDWTERDAAQLTSGLTRYRVGAVVLSRQAGRNLDLAATLKEAGFRRGKAGVPGFQLWLPKAPKHARKKTE